jgi:leader peptidase (prepilin peptidase)/N-methyltransferase
MYEFLRLWIDWWAAAIPSSPQADLLPTGADGLIISIYCLTLMLVGSVDLFQRRVPNAIIFPMTLLALLAGLFSPQPARALLLTGGGATVGLASFLALRWAGERRFGPGSLGMGDVKLAMLLGAMVGLHLVTAVLLLGILLAGVAGFLLLLARRQPRQHLPYAFFLSAAGILILLFIPLD